MVIVIVQTHWHTGACFHLNTPNEESSVPVQCYPPVPSMQHQSVWCCGGLGLTWLIITLAIVADDAKKSRLMLKVSKLCNNWPALPLTFQTLQPANPDQGPGLTHCDDEFEATFPRLQEEKRNRQQANFKFFLLLLISVIEINFILPCLDLNGLRWLPFPYLSLFLGFNIAQMLVFSFGNSLGWLDIVVRPNVNVIGSMSE